MIPAIEEIPIVSKELTLHVTILFIIVAFNIVLRCYLKYYYSMLLTGLMRSLEIFSQ